MALPPGVHHVTVKAAGYFPWDREVKAEAGLRRRSCGSQRARLTAGARLSAIRLTGRRFPSRHCAPSYGNRAIWNVRKRHEWLATPLKAKRIKRAQRLRNGQQEAHRPQGRPPGSPNET